MTYTYNDAPPLVQVARATATTHGHVVFADAGLVAFDRAGIAAKAGRVCANSFTGTTLVFMGDGTKKPITEVRLGDQVMATDSETGETGPREVLDLIRHGGLHTMVAVRPWANQAAGFCQTLSFLSSLKSGCVKN